MRLPIVPILLLAGCPASVGMPPAIQVVADPIQLTDLAKQAVDLAPSWLQDPLAIQLDGLEDAQQDTLAALVVDLDEPWLTDEVAFLVAYTSPEVLEDDDFYPEMIVQNAQLVYERDPLLPYVELQDVGEPGVDADYYTTAAYQVEVDGAVQTHTLEYMDYYWYVVHFRLEDEWPFYIDPYDTCGGAQCPTDPSVGSSWRDFLWSAADEECPSGVAPCPVLSEVMSAQQVLWKGYGMSDDGSLRRDDNGAIGALTRWIQDVLDFGAGSERPVQPNRIYGLHRGNCGEHADLTTAAGRTALLPVHNVGAWANDHTWNEVMDQRWVQMEPVNTYVDYWWYYADSNGDYYRSRDRVDNNCDTVADEGTDTADNDGDGFSPATGDCDDTRADRSPDAPEAVNGLDDNCDGQADEGALSLDQDGDGWTLEYDCDDTQADTFLGADELPDLRDNDCDGYADDHADLLDADLDGVTIADGDCDDSDPARAPGVQEARNSRDDNCDGFADEALDEADLDGDGWSPADGDCDDTSGGNQPDADDPSHSTNRVMAISAARGDGRLWQRTEDYGGEFTWRFLVTDEAGNPVDGANVQVYGDCEVYADCVGYIIHATDGVTGPDGVAELVLGEANNYYFRVESPEGTYPEEADVVMSGPKWPSKGTVENEEVTLPFVLPDPRPGTDTSQDGGQDADADLTVSWNVTDTWIQSTTMMFEDTFRLPFPGGAVDAWLMGKKNFDLFAAGEPFEAQALGQGAASAQVDVALTLDQSWFLVFENRRTVASTMAGTLDVVVTAREGADWNGSSTASFPFRIGPGDWMAVEISE